MNITRRGAERDHGEKDILRDVPLRDEGYYFQRNVQWIPYANKVKIRTGAAKDPTGKSRHIYSIVLDLDDIATLIKMLGHIASEHNASAFRDSLADYSDSIIRLLSCSAGLIPIEIPEEEDAESE